MNAAEVIAKLKLCVRSNDIEHIESSLAQCKEYFWRLHRVYGRVYKRFERSKTDHNWNRCKRVEEGRRPIDRLSWEIYRRLMGLKEIDFSVSNHGDEPSVRHYPHAGGTNDLYSVSMDSDEFDYEYAAYLRPKDVELWFKIGVLEDLGDGIAKFIV